MKVAVHLDGPPVGKGRPRFVRRGAGVGTYTPGKTAAYERFVAARWREQGARKLQGPIQLTIHAHFQFPKSWSKSRRGDLRPHTSKPDLDNIVKIVGDALNGVAFDDDSQIATVIATKCIGETPPCVWITLEEINGTQA